MSILKNVWLAAVLCFAALININAAPPVLDPASAPITLGVWHSDFNKAKAYSEQHDIPLLFVWGSATCGYCTKLDGYIAQSVFTTWQADRKLVMAYVKSPNTDTTPEKSFAKYGLNGTLTEFPFIAVYWKSKNSSGAYNFTGRYSGASDAAKAQAFINDIEAYISEYTGAPDSPLSIDGPVTVNENTATQFQALFNLDANPEVNVTAASTWDENNAATTIAGGLLTAGEVTSDQSVTVTVDYSQGGENYQATKVVTVKNVPGPFEIPASIEIVGPGAVQGGTTAQYQCILHYNDGVSTMDVTAQSSWAETSFFTMIDSDGLLTVKNVFNEMTTTLSAEYTVPGGATFTDEKIVDLTLDAPVPDPDPDPGPDPDPSGVTLGEWTTDFNAAKAYSEAHDIPMVLLWGFTGCSYCTKMDGYIARTAFLQWMADRQLVMAYVKASDISATPEKNFAKYGINGTLGEYPFIGVYWPSKNAQAYNFTGRYSGGNEEQKFINDIESYISTYVSGPVTPPAVDAFDPADDAFTAPNTLDLDLSCPSHGEHYLNQNDTNDWFEVVNTEAGTDYRIWVSDFSESGTADLRADFYQSPTNSPYMSMPLADLQAGQIFAGGAPFMVNVARAADTNATATYTLNVCEWVPCTLSLTESNVTVNAASGSLTVEIQRTGEQVATSATLTMVDGSATAGQDYNGTPVTVNFTAAGGNLQTATIPLIQDNAWEPDETFTVIMTPDPATAVAGEITEQTVTIKSNIQPDSGELAFTGYGPGNTRISSRGIKVREGETVRLWVERDNGSDTAVAAQFAWSNGGAGFDVDPLAWGHGEDGLQFVDVTVPIVPGYQGDAVVILTMTSPDTTVNTRYDEVRFSVADSEYGTSVRTYVADNDTLSYRTYSDEWFYPGNAEGEDCLRSRTPENVGDSADLTVTLAGPGVLSFAAGLSDAIEEGIGAGLYTITIGRGAPAVIPADGENDLAFIIPAGRQRVTLSFERTAQSIDGDFAWICDANYVKLDEIAQIAPLNSAAVPEGEQALVWDNALAPLAGIDGLDATYVVYAGGSSTTMEEVDNVPVQTAGILSAVPESVSTLINVTPGEVFWRVDVLLDDGVAPVQFEGGTSSFEVVPAGSPQFDVDPSQFETEAWFSDITGDGATVTMNLMLGMDSEIGPFDLSVEPGGELSVRVVDGRLPRGMAAQVIQGAVVITGTPTSAGEGTAVLRVLVKEGTQTTYGTTLGIIYNVVALPEKSYGTFEGVAMFHDPVNDVEVPVTAKVTIRDNGKASGRLTAAGGSSFSFRTDGYNGTEYYQNGLYVQNAVVTSRDGKTLSVDMVINLNGAGPMDVLPDWGSTPMAVSLTVDDNGQTGDTLTRNIYRNAWRDRDLDPEMAQALEQSEGYYTVSLPGSAVETAPRTIIDDDEYGNGYLTLTVNNRGAVRVSGKLADGERFSASASLVVTPEGTFVIVMDDPRSYDTGYFLATMEFLVDPVDPAAMPALPVPSTRNEPLIAVSYWWVNYNPEATGVFGEGFDRMVEDEIAGGYYSKNESLYDYFLNAPLGFQACYDNWDCETVNLPVNDRGTGFDLPGGGTTANPFYLSVRTRLSTGLLSIGFRDYPDGGTGYTSLKGEGVLTPYFQLVPDLNEIAGRAYILRSTDSDNQEYSWDASTPLVLTEDCGCTD